MAESIAREQAKRWWRHCFSCSEASVTQHDRSFGVEDTRFEESAGLFSGGFLHQGDTCGLLQGAVLAAGVQAQARFSDDAELAVGAAIVTAQELARRYDELAGSTACRELTKIDLTRATGRLRYMRTGGAKACGRRSLQWVDVGHEVIADGLAQCEREAPRRCRSCVVDAARRLESLQPSDAVRLAGYSGGVGLSGEVCGVLAAGVFAIAAPHYEGRGPEARDSQLVSAIDEAGFDVGLRRKANRLRRDFEARFGSLLCRDVSGRRFSDAEQFSTFIEEGGCAEVVEFCVEQVNAARG